MRGKGQQSRVYIAELYKVAGFGLFAPFGTYYIQTLVLNKDWSKFFGIELLATLLPLIYGLLLFVSGYHMMLKLDEEVENDR